MVTAQAVAPAQRSRRRQAVLTVTGVQRIAPHLVRVTAGGAGFADLTGNDSTDKYVKISFADPALNLTPPYDLEALRSRLSPAQMPSTRTYTVRRFDAEAQEIDLDFVTHGEQGIAGPWAERAAPGDLLVLSGCGGGYAPDPTADWHLFVGDDAALPAIAASLETLPADAVGVALLEVDGPADRVTLTAPSGVEVRWLYRGGAQPGSTTLLADALTGLAWPAGRVHAFVHGERETMKRLRDHLFGQRGLTRDQVSLSAYWARGRTEDRFQAEKREPIGQL